jgi:hypothetical protein
MTASKASQQRTYRMLAVLAAALLSADAVQAQQVGTAAAVNPAAQARGAGGARTIVIGQSIAHRERIQTTAAGSVQLLFIDKTSMTIGPNSDLAIDEYVYDPNTNTGKMAVTLSKGLMRFVGGQVSHTGNAQITTPTAVVGIRGGVGIVGTNQVYIGYGVGEVASASYSVSLSAGEYTQTQGGVPPTAPAPPPPGLIAALVATFQSQGGQGGGAPASGNKVDQARTSATGSSGGSIATATAAASVGSGSQQQATQFTAKIASVTETTQTTAQQSVAQTVANELVQQQEQQEAIKKQFSSTAFVLGMSNCCSLGNPTSPVPYLPASFATGTNRFVSPIMGYRLGSLEVANRAPYFQWGIGITGDGASQNSWFFVMTGALVENNSGGFELSSGFSATRRGSGTTSMGLANGAVSSQAGTIVLDPERLPVSGVATNQDFIATLKEYRNTPAFAYLGGPTQGSNYEFTQQFARLPTPSFLGSDRPPETLVGWTGGLIRTSVNGVFQSAAIPTVGTAQIQLSPTQNRLQANFTSFNFSPDGSGPSNNFQFGQFQMGSLDPSLRGRGAYVDYDNFAARAAIVVNNEQTESSLLSSVNGQTLTGNSVFMVNVPRAVAQQIDPDTTFCQCDYTRWGFWSVDGRRTVNGQNVADLGHLMTWVAGRPPNINEVPSTGHATYTGHVVASVLNNGAEYVTSGNLVNTINFGTRTGTGSVTGFDGTNYSGQLTLMNSDPRFFGGGLNGNNGNRSMIMVGNLFKGVSSPVGEMGGNVLISGTNYRGSGIFAGRMQ